MILDKKIWDGSVTHALYAMTEQCCCFAVYPEHQMDAMICFAAHNCCRTWRVLRLHFFLPLPGAVDCRCETVPARLALSGVCADRARV